MIKQRFLIYFTGAALGVILAMFLLKIKGEAPKSPFIDERKEFSKVVLKKGTNFSLEFVPLLAQRMVATYPNQLVLGQQQPNQRWKPLYTWQTERLAPPVIALEETNAVGNYEARLMLYLCEKVDLRQNCKRLILILPFAVSEQGEEGHREKIAVY